MTDIKAIPAELCIDFIAVITDRYGKPAGTRKVILPDGTEKDMAVTEYRIPHKAHRDLAESFYLDVSHDHETDETVFSFIPRKLDS